MININIIPVLEDNYTYLLRGENGQTAIIDPGLAAPVITELERQSLNLDMIINTHYHWDHTDGNLELKEKYNCPVYGPNSPKTPGLTHPLHEGDEFTFGGEPIQIIETPGHTLDHICFYFQASKAVFTGDTLFCMSTGRLFEGTPTQMWSSLEKLMALPDDTAVYCGHEYTLSNGKFCLTQEPDNKDLITRMNNARTLRAANAPTIPSTIGLEKKTNTFIRAGSAEKYKEIRALRDQS